MATVVAERSHGRTRGAHFAAREDWPCSPRTSLGSSGAPVTPLAGPGRSRLSRAEQNDRNRALLLAAARRAMQAGFRILEIHSAHGYLLHSFLSPLANHRTDRYGGNLENRMRLVLEVAAALRAVMPDDMPLFMRISSTDWVNDGWDLEQSVALAHALKAVGVDLVDASSGGAVPGAKIPITPGYQVPFAAANGT